MIKEYETNTDLIKDYIYQKYTNPIFKDLPRICLKLSLENNTYYQALRCLSKETLITKISYIQTLFDLETIIKGEINQWILTMNNKKL